MRVFQRQRLVNAAMIEDIALLVIHHEDVAQRAVDQVEAEVGAHLAQVIVVLKEGIEEHPGAEGVVRAQCHEMAGGPALRQAQLVALVPD